MQRIVAVLCLVTKTNLFLMMSDQKLFYYSNSSIRIVTCILSACMLCFMSCSKSTQFVSRWKKTNSTYSGQLLSLCFTSKDTGFALATYNPLSGNTLWLKTTDGGEFWQIDTIRVGESKAHISTLISYNHILYAGGFVNVGNTVPRRTYRSTDNGRTWQIIDTTMIRGNMVFMNNNNIILGYLSNLYKSSDAGSSFQQTFTDPLSIGFPFIQFPDGQTGYASGGFSSDGHSTSTMAKSIDGGNSWISVQTGLPKIVAMNFFDKSNGTVFIYDEKGSIAQITYSDYKIFKTSDGASTWNLVRDNIINEFGIFTSGYFKDVSNGFMTTEHFIYATQDGGRSWSKEYDASDVTVQGKVVTGLYLASPNQMFAYSTDGTIYKRLE